MQMDDQVISPGRNALKRKLKGSVTAATINSAILKVPSQSPLPSTMGSHVPTTTTKKTTKDMSKLSNKHKCKAITGTSDGLNALLNEGYKHYNWYEIQKRATLGCALCKNIWDTVRYERWDQENDGSVPGNEILIVGFVTLLTSPVERRISRHPLQDIQLHWLEGQIQGNDGGRRPYTGPRFFYLVTLDADSSSDFVPGRRESKELSSKVVNKIRGWLDDCLDTHQGCPRRCTPDLPMRVLDVGADGSTIRLHQPQKNEKAHYAALSYCWGSSVQHVTTNTSNLHTHLFALPDRLPKTISDAVEVCRKVGIPYLWVDALCIIQDDDSEKQDLLSKMGLSYKGSTVTIVAASAESSTDGFLDGKLKKPFAQPPLFVNASTTGTVYLRHQYEEHINLRDEPAYERAWTLQELLLSPRALVFDTYQITLKCLEHEFKPVFETYLESISSCPNIHVSLFGLVDIELASQTSKESRENYLRCIQDELWAEIIDEYSMRDLTLFEDRLLALAGIATELNKLWNDDYIAGLWEKTITQHLGWGQSPPHRTLSPKKIFQNVDCTGRIGLPTWSWVFVPYAVLTDPVQGPDLKWVRSSVHLVSQKSPFGQVKGACITVEGRALTSKDLKLTFTREFSRYNDSIVLDFEDLKPELDSCRLLYLGKRIRGCHGVFLAVEKLGSGRYRRVGYFELDIRTGTCLELLTSARREILTTE